MQISRILYVKNIAYKHYLFGKLSQTAVEPIDAFITMLRLFGDQEESPIRDQVVICYADFQVKKQLLRELDLSIY